MTVVVKRNSGNCPENETGSLYWSRQGSFSPYLIPPEIGGRYSLRNIVGFDLKDSVQNSATNARGSLPSANRNWEVRIMKESTAFGVIASFV